jgi:hypothetical protein
MVPPFDTETDLGKHFELAQLLLTVFRIIPTSPEEKFRGSVRDVCGLFPSPVSIDFFGIVKPVRERNDEER